MIAGVCLVAGTFVAGTLIGAGIVLYWVVKGWDA